MEYPKKITKRYENGQQPQIIIRGSGNPSNITIKEYKLIKQYGNMYVYK